MREQDLNELLALEKKFYAKLSEMVQISTELMDAVGRQDPVTLDMLISMRQKPLMDLQEIQGYIKLKRVDLTREDAEHFDLLLSGEPTGRTEDRAVHEQINTNRSLYQRLLALDKSLNTALCGDQSYYAAI